MNAPRDETRQRVGARLAARRQSLAATGLRERRAIYLTVTTFFGGLLLVLAGAEGLAPIRWSWCLLIAIGAWMPAIAWRVAQTRKRRRLEAVVAWLERAAARLEDRFAFGQDGGEAYEDPQHPYASDLDFFGPGSVFERLNACHTALGRDALAAMLHGGDEAVAIPELQESLAELEDEVDWREELEVRVAELGALAGDDATMRRRIDEDTRALADWGESATPPPEARARVVRDVALAVVATAAVITVPVFGWPWSLIIPFYLANYLVQRQAEGVDELEKTFEGVRVTLALWSAVFAHLESRAFRARHLEALRGQLASSGLSASGAIAGLDRRAEKLTRRNNALWRFTLGTLWLSDLSARRGLFAWKREHGASLRRWFAAAGRFEAAVALATYREAVPDHVLPEIVVEGPLLDAEDLQHPLLARDRRVGNSLVLSEAGSVLLVTGSNMSGKSTFLRSVGLAVVFSHLGLPVPARRLRMRDLALVTCMRVQDSLREGSSLFHAEVRRLKQCLDTVGDGRLAVVLLDEILAGTNSRERHLGALAVIRSLSATQTATLVSTHDLGLCAIAKEIPERTRVVHFRDRIEDGAMVFDYVMRDGPVPSTNALRVMRSMGLEVPEAKD